MEKAKKKQKTLAQKACAACKGGIPPFTSKEILEYLEQIEEGWQVMQDHHLQREFQFPDFKTALAFTNKVGEVAEREGHHPDIYLSWGKVKITLWTHKIDGLSESDFIIASKIDELCP